MREPTFEENGLFKATFYRPEIPTAKTTQKTTQKILQAIRDNPNRTRKELAAEVGISEDGVKYHLKKMVKKGLLRRIGPDRGGHWDVVEKGS
ncbi:MAG: winged helix-turn-helix domain-containing protein [Thermoplasmata archaeon]|nr:winged helix-turn-helix domain-containing protein [Thermoplasmata archaeon]